MQVTLPAPIGGIVEYTPSELLARQWTYTLEGDPPQAATIVVLKDYIPEVQIGSIGIRQASAGTEHWTWGIDTMIAMREAEAQGRGKDRKDCMKQFKAA